MLANCGSDSFLVQRIAGGIYRSDEVSRELFDFLATDGQNGFGHVAPKDDSFLTGDPLLGHGVLHIYLDPIDLQLDLHVT